MNTETRAKARKVLIALATVTGIAITGSLGNWQLNRAAQKIAMQAAMDAPSAERVVQVSTLLAAKDPLALEHEYASLRGQWLADQTIYLDNRQMHDKVGFFAITPLKLEGSDAVILVQRGWVQRNFEERTKVPAIQTPAGTVTVEGRIAPTPGKLFELGTPSQTAIRQNLDLDQFRAQSHLQVLPVLLQQTGAASEGLLREWPAINLGVEKHYGYALQWFGMAAVLALLYLWYQIVKPYFLRTKDTDSHA